MSIVLYVGGISGYVERKYIGRFGIRESRIWISREIFRGRDEELVKVIKLQRIEQGRIYARVSKGSKR